MSPETTFPIRAALRLEAERLHDRADHEANAHVKWLFHKAAGHYDGAAVLAVEAMRYSALAETAKMRLARENERMGDAIYIDVEGDDPGEE